MIEGEWSIEGYNSARWWSAREVPVCDLVSLGQALADLERDPHSCVIRGQPIDGVDLRAVGGSRTPIRMTAHRPHSRPRRGDGSGSTSTACRLRSGIPTSSLAGARPSNAIAPPIA